MNLAPTEIDWSALWLTLRLASVTTVLLLVIALPLGWWLALHRSTVSRVVEAIVALPLVLPPTVLGFYLLVLLGPRTSIGRAIAHVLGHPLAFSFQGLVAGSVLYSLPFAVQPVVAGFSGVDSDLIDAARLLGAGGAAILSRVLIPLSRRSILAAAVLTFAHTVGEFGVVLMIGGSIPGRTQTLSISIYDQVQTFNYAGANRTALLLVAVSLVALIAIYARRGRSESHYV
jgi:molybdate transport system permease protein